ncbi:hypothetical protein DFH06DRAFT_1342537 [Mycena polygramma]|nr:hypothetical protein DFH06DRAFT_1342537 [Mycena polygramma]
MPGPPPPYSVSDPHIQQSNAQVDPLIATVSNLNISGRTRAPLPVGNRRPQNTPPSSPVPAPLTPPRPVRRYQFTSPTRSGTTTEWSEASQLSQGVPQGSVRSVVPKSPKKRSKKKAYVVFYGIIPGVYPEWYGPEGAEVQVSGVPGSLYQGYSSPVDADGAYNYARGRNWTGVRTRHSRLRSDRAPPSSSAIEALPVPTPLFDFSHNPLHGPVNSGDRTWYIVYAGITPGIYLSHLECALNTVGLPCASHDSTDSLDEARRRWDEAVSAGSIHVVNHPYN